MRSSENEDKFIKARWRMIDCDLKGRGITDPGVLKVVSEIRREEFVPAAYQSQAYADGPLPIGMGQTISQPFIVALMSQELRLNSYCEVLEIGTGSGYQTAILSRLAKKVYTIDRIAQLSESAQAVLGRLGISNVEFFVGDGSCGWPEERCFDRIIFTATAPTMPKPLVQQLAKGGLMVGPVGYGAVQQLMVWEKKKEKILKRTVCEVRFVKLFGEYGFEQ
ncbi:MAG: protein-L-isoaspartate(D-aspartate) O-methyltransferase [Planctomycetota bacterium]|jgi:protein-L-isoaspartate(D-aspartate) O-methyltransferase